MSISPLAFTGLSQFSDDFQAIVNRTVAIANLPIQGLESDQAAILTKKTVMSSLRSAVANLASAIETVGTVSTGRAISPASSSSKVGVAISGVAAAGSYVISDITSLASVASATSTSGYDSRDAAPLGGANLSVILTVGASTHTIPLTASSDNLDGLAAAINSGDYGVRASIIDTGASSGRYFLALTATEAGPKTISMQTAGLEPRPELLTTTQPGSNAVFRINGQEVISASNTISTVVEGLAITLNETTGAGETVTVSAQSSRNTLSSALDSLSKAYNTLRDAIDAQTGENGSVLAGDRIINEIQARMRAIVGVAGNDGNGSLANVGLAMTASGQMTFNSNRITTMNSVELESAFAFLDNRPGSLGAMTSSLDQLSDAETGMMTSEIGFYDETDKRLTSQIERLSERVTSLQTTLFSQLQAADALLAQLASQKSMLEASVESLYLVLYGRKDA